MLQRSAVWLSQVANVRTDVEAPRRQVDRPHKAFIELLQERFDTEPVTMRPQKRAQ